MSAGRSLKRRDEPVRAAARGDQHAFRRLVEPLRSQLHAHCYQLLGCVHEADDAVQEALLRAWRGLSSFDPERPLRPWLYKIATNVCLNMLARRDRRILPFDLRDQGSGEGAQLPASTWITPYPDQDVGLASGYASPEARYEQREAIELAFVAALQQLPARQRAIFVLRDVLGFSAPEIAENLGTSTASVNSALQRARETLGGLLPGRSQCETLDSLGEHRVRAIAKRFADAMESGDIEGVLALLDDDPSFAMPPYTRWARGRGPVSSSWLMPPAEAGLLRLIPVRANAQLAFAAYRLYPGGRSYVPLCLDVVSVEGERVQSVIAFRDVDLFAWFDLPERLPLVT